MATLPKRSSREREKGEPAAKGGAGIPVNSCTMARKLEVSVARTVVGALREARDRFFGLRGAGPDVVGKELPQPDAAGDEEDEPMLRGTVAGGGGGGLGADLIHIMSRLGATGGDDREKVSR